MCVQIEGLSSPTINSLLFSNYCGISAKQLKLLFTMINSIFTYLRNTKVVFYREPLSAVLKPQQCCGERGMDKGETRAILPADGGCSLFLA